MNSHLHPARPYTPSRFRYAALSVSKTACLPLQTHACRYPENIEPRELPMNQTPARLKSSSPLNQLPTDMSDVHAQTMTHG
jgi:hypothetical protein